MVSMLKKFNAIKIICFLQTHDKGGYLNILDFCNWASPPSSSVLQLQHSLEAQIAALVSNLQVLHENQGRQQQKQDKEKENALQQQMEERLKRLEELQEKMLQVQVQ